MGLLAWILTGLYDCLALQLRSSTNVLVAPLVSCVQVSLQAAAARPRRQGSSGPHATGGRGEATRVAAPRGSHQSCGAAARLRRLALSGREGMGRLQPAAPCQSRGGGNAVLLRLCCRRLLVLAPVTRRPLDAEGASLGGPATSGGSLAPGVFPWILVTGICRPRL